MPMTEDELELAENCYGYGRWDAPYWFIGLEQGQSNEDKNDVNPRAKVFAELGKNGLCDCAEFHNHPKINEPWFRGEKPRTQETWRSLILLLKAYLNGDTGLESRRIYQRDKWGRSGSDGETCVIELSGLPANNVKISRNRESHLSERIPFIQKQLPDPYPEFVVMYGKSGKEHWEKIAGVTLQLDIPQKVGATTFLFARHPTDFFEKGQKKNHYYKALGASLREESGRS